MNKAYKQRTHKMFFVKSYIIINLYFTLWFSDSLPLLCNFSNVNCFEYSELDYLIPVKVRPMPDMWVQTVPVTAIPWGTMKTEQRNLVIRSLREDD